jgi:hypothetical protein
MRLLIYLNIAEYGTMQKKIEGAMADATTVAKDAFSQVWVLWKSQLYLVWNNGERATLRLPITDLF